jgi:hypothetical protein
MLTLLAALLHAWQQGITGTVVDLPIRHAPALRAGREEGH